MTKPKKIFGTLLLVPFGIILVACSTYFLLNINKIIPAEQTTSQIISNEPREQALIVSTNTANVDNSVMELQNILITASSAPKVFSTSTDEIYNKKFELLTKGSIPFGDAVKKAKDIEKITNVRPAFLLGILQEELSLEKTDMCYLTNLQTGEGVREVDGVKRPKTMHVTRDIPPFLTITKELGIDPLKTLITCPMSFGYGGAMGPADFIPSTWMAYRNRVKKITGKSANPWDINDALIAEGLFLSDNGASLRTRAGEWRSAMIYFSGSAKSKYTWYADGAMKFADEIEKDIKELERRQLGLEN